MNAFKKYSFFVVLAFTFSFMLLKSQISMAQEPLPAGLNIQVQYAKQQEEVWAVVELSIAPEYYAYAPQDTQGVSVNPGQAMQILVHNAMGQPVPVYLPQGVERADYYEKNKRIFAYTGAVYAFIPLGSTQDVAAGKSFTAQLELLLCSTQHCLPVRMPLTLTAPEHIPPLQEQSYAAVWQKTTALEPQALPESRVEPSAMEKNLAGDGMNSEGALGGLAANLEQFTRESAASQTELTETSSMAVPQNTDASSTDFNFTPRAHAPHLEVVSLGKALLLGLLAGLILNLMPCVLPVLTLKIQSLLLSEEGEKRIQAFRTHNVFFAAGIITQFLILGLLLGAFGLMWGELFQNVYFVASMLVIIFALALSLMGLYSLPMLDIKGTAHASPSRQAFVTGMVATLLATPCSGPLLGGVLSWAFLQPLYLIVCTVTAVGLGMALPYMLLAWQPQWVRFLPKPGAWMEVLEKLVAFFLLGTVLYIFSILPSYAHFPMLSGLLLLAMAGWFWGHFGGLAAPLWRRRVLGAIFLLSMVAVVSFSAQEPRPVAVTWQNFDAYTFQEQLGKKPLLVEFTADWCPNCKYVEKTVLTTENLQNWQEQYGVQLIKVDITRNNHAGEALLHALGSRSIPLTAIFGLEESATSPVVIRDIYTKDTLEEALRQTLK